MQNNDSNKVRELSQKINDFTTDNYIYGYTESHSSIVTSSDRSLNGLEPLSVTHLKYRIVTEWLPERISSHPSVKSLIVDCDQVQSLDWLSCFPNLTTLHVKSNQLSDISGLSHVPDLEELAISTGIFDNVQELALLPKLKSLSLSECNSITDLEALGSLPSLNEAHIENCFNLRDVSAWFEKAALWEAKSTIELKGLPNINNLGDVSGLSYVKNVLLEHSINTEVFPQFKKLKNLSYLCIVGSPSSKIELCDDDEPHSFQLEIKDYGSINLEGSAFRKLILTNIDHADLTSISKLSKLEHLQININLKLESLDGLEFVKELQSLNLNNCSKLRSTQALSRLQKLVQLKIEHSPVLDIKPQAYNMSAERTIHYQSKLLRAAGLDPEPILKDKKSRIEQDSTLNYDKKALSKIKKLLLTRDNDNIDLAIQLLSSIQDHRLYDALLEGTTTQKGKLIPNKTFTGTGSKPARVYLNYAVLHLLKLASELEPWKTVCDNVLIWEEVISGDAPFDQFTNLEMLHIKHVLKSELHLPNLKKLSLEVTEFDSCLVTYCSALHEIDIKTIHLNNGFIGFRLLKELKSLRVNFEASDMVSLKGLENCSKLEKLYLKGKYYYAHSGPKILLKSLEPLSVIKSLKQLEFKDLDFPNTNELHTLSNLENINISNNDVIEELTLPAALSHLKYFDLSYCRNLTKICDTTWPQNGLYLTLSDLKINRLPKLVGVSSLSRLFLRGLNQLQHIDELLGISVNQNDLYINFGNSLLNMNGLRDLGLKELFLETSKIPASVDLESITKLKLKGNLTNLEGISVFVNLEKLDLSNSEIISLDGLEKCQKLTLVDISETYLKNVDALKQSSVKELNVRGSIIKTSDVPPFIRVFRSYVY